MDYVGNVSFCYAKAKKILRTGKAKKSEIISLIGVHNARKNTSDVPLIMMKNNYKIPS